VTTYYFYIRTAKRTPNYTETYDGNYYLDIDGPLTKEKLAFVRKDFTYLATKETGIDYELDRTVIKFFAKVE
jgi:hypothetical protein